MKKYIVFLILAHLFFAASTDCYSQEKSRVFPTKVLKFKGHSFESYSYIAFNSTVRDLGIPLPIKLDGRYDRYTYCRDSNGNILPQPKAFRWPNHRKREGMLIE